MRRSRTIEDMTNKRLDRNHLKTWRNMEQGLTPLDKNQEQTTPTGIVKRRSQNTGENTPQIWLDKRHYRRTTLQNLRENKRK